MQLVDQACSRSMDEERMLVSVQAASLSQLGYPCYKIPRPDRPLEEIMRDGFPPFRLPLSLGFYLIERRWWRATNHFYERLQALSGRTSSFGELPSPRVGQITSSCRIMLEAGQAELLVHLLRLVHPDLVLSEIRTGDPGRPNLLSWLLEVPETLTPIIRSREVNRLLLRIEQGNQTSLEQSLAHGETEIFHLLVRELRLNSPEELELSLGLTVFNPETSSSPLEAIFAKRLLGVISCLHQKGYFGFLFSARIREVRRWQYLRRLTMPEREGERGWDELRVKILLSLLDDPSSFYCPAPEGTSIFLFPLEGYDPFKPDLCLLAGLGMDLINNRLPAAKAYRFLRANCAASEDEVKIRRVEETYMGRIQMTSLFECFCTGTFQTELRVFLMLNLAGFLNWQQVVTAGSPITFTHKWATVLFLLASAGYPVEGINRDQELLDLAPAELLGKLTFRLRAGSPSESAALEALMSSRGYV